MANEIIIHDGNYRQFLNEVVDGETVSYGCIPRDESVQPRQMKAVEFPLIPKTEWSTRIREMTETRSRLSDLRMIGDAGRPIPSLNQNGQGYCWAYSATMATMMLRLKVGSPYVPLSAHGVACKIKSFADEGAWGALGLDFISKNGAPSQSLWPQGSMSRSHDTNATWADAAKYRVTKSWADLESPVYNRNLTFQQVMTLLLNRIPVVADYYWWGHSVCLIDPVEVEAGSFGVRLINSWGDNWSDRGTGVIQGEKAIPNGATAPAIALA